MADTNNSIITAKALCLGLMQMDGGWANETRPVQEREDARFIADTIRSMVPDIGQLASLCAEIEHKTAPHISRDHPTSDNNFGPDLFRSDEARHGYPDETPWDDDSDEPEPPTWAESNGLAEVQDDFMRRIKLIRMEQREAYLRQKRQKAAEKRDAKRQEMQSKIVRILSGDQVNMLSKAATNYSNGNVH